MLVKKALTQSEAPPQPPPVARAGVTHAHGATRQHGAHAGQNMHRGNVPNIWTASGRWDDGLGLLGKAPCRRRCAQPGAPAPRAATLLPKALHQLPAGCWESNPLPPPLVGCMAAAPPKELLAAPHPLVGGWAAPRKAAAAAAIAAAASHGAAGARPQLVFAHEPARAPAPGPHGPAGRPLCEVVRHIHLWLCRLQGRKLQEVGWPTSMMVGGRKG